jgi:hypothetical protein
MNLYGPVYFVGIIWVDSIIMWRIVCDNLIISARVSIFSSSDDSGGVCDGVEYYPRDFYRSTKSY